MSEKEHFRLAKRAEDEFTRTMPWREKVHECELNSYRFLSGEEPSDEMLSCIMREVAEDARESTRRAAERVAAEIEAAVQVARTQVEETLNRLHDERK